MYDFIIWQTILFRGKIDNILKHMDYYWVCYIQYLGYLFCGKYIVYVNAINSDSKYVFLHINMFKYSYSFSNAANASYMDDMFFQNEFCFVKE